MNNILKIIFRDFKRIVKNPIALTVIIGVCCIPSLYAWFNIGASWDPYGSTKGIKVAVANNDVGSEISGIGVNFGNDIVDTLKENNDIGWIFVDEQNAIEGVKNGSYYAGIVIPKNFSENFASILTNDIKQPTIKYYVNEKKNAIAPKITDKGVSVVQQKVNETFLDETSKSIEGALKVIKEQAKESKINIADRMMSTLTEVSNSLNKFKDLGTSFDESLNSIKALIKTTKTVLPSGVSLTQTAEEIANDTNVLLHSTTQVFDGINNTIETFLDSAKALSDDMFNIWDDVSSINKQNVDIIKSQIGFLRRRSNDLININEDIKSILSDTNNVLPIKLNSVDKFIERINTINKGLKEIISLTNNIDEIIKNGGKLNDTLENGLKEQVNQVKSDILDVKDIYQKNVQPSIDTSAENFYKMIIDFNLLSKNTGYAIQQLNPILDGIYSSLEYAQKSISATTNVINITQKDLQDMKKKINDIKTDENLDKLSEILENDPDVVGKFISAPVQIETVGLYKIKNYGSAMTPFYSILSLWVGALLLVSLLKVKVNEDDYVNNIKPYQAYVGRYMLFLTISIVQSIIVCLGDLYILGIQCENPVLFMLVGITASLVFSNIIYTIVVSFGDVGKSICIFLLVIQVAGAGGTFPIEVTPTFFQKINPYLPFTYGINAMRETVGGIFEDAYKNNMLKLLSFLPASLLLGFILRYPLIKVTEFFEEKLEETHLM